MLPAPEQVKVPEQLPRRSAPAPARAWFLAFGASERAGLEEPRDFRSFASGAGAAIWRVKVRRADDFCGQDLRAASLVEARSREDTGLQRLSRTVVRDHSSDDFERVPARETRSWRR